jgi:hypothetical protein
MSTLSYKDNIFFTRYPTKEDFIKNKYIFRENMIINYLHTSYHLRTKREDDIIHAFINRMKKNKLISKYELSVEEYNMFSHRYRKAQSASLKQYSRYIKKYFPSTTPTHTTHTPTSTPTTPTPTTPTPTTPMPTYLFFSDMMF